jgi:uncharacterized OB-fold protein|tara:strand:+ start:839 stop:1225 length:387 start_codon:yes stop_codon:yes gene_type:complete
LISSWRLKDRYYRIVGTRCKECEKKYFPPQRICKNCKSENIEDYEMPKKGKLITYTFLHEPMSDFKDQIPLPIGIIELDKGVKFPAQLVDATPENVKIGMKVEAVFRRIKVDGESGQIQYGYKFRVIE